MEITEILTEAGVETEVVEKVTGLVAERGLNVILDNKANPGYIPKSRFDEVNTQKNQFKTQADELVGKLTEYESKQTEIEEKVAGYDKLKSDYEKVLRETEIRNKILPHSPRDGTGDDILKFIDIGSIEVNETGEMVNIDEVIKGIVEGKAYLFGGEQQDVRRGLGTGTNPGTSPHVKQSVGDILKDKYK